tara:strand:+ start:9189 stop:10244 length:1056 start_codon:yes stop_codon:yes gene_type:complete
MNDEKRYRLKEDEWKLIDEYRTDRKKDNLLADECKASGIDINSISHYWYKSKKFSIFAKPNEFTKDEFLKSIEDLISKYSPKYPSIDYPKREDGHLLIINPADVHIGKYADALETGEEYNVEIAKNRVREGVKGILRNAEGFNIDKILFCIGNDILHTDNTMGSTTRLTPQDTDKKWYRHFTEALELYVEIVEMLMQIAPVDCIHSMSNHDYMSGFHLAHALKSWYRNTDAVTVDADPKHRKYYTYKNSMIGLTHGDGAKLNTLPLLMAQEEPLMWSYTKYRYWYLHHLHHKQRYKFMTSFDNIGVTVEFLRSPSASDSWHYQKGYTGSVKAVEGFIHSEYGQIAHLTHIF